MKKKFLFSTVMSLILMLTLALPVFAKTASTSINIQGGDFTFCCNKYIKLDSKGDIEVAFSEMSRLEWDITVVLFNDKNNYEESKTLTQDKNSHTFKNVPKGLYNIRLDNNNGYNNKGSFAFSWPGKWGGQIN